MKEVTATPKLYIGIDLFSSKTFTMPPDF